MMKRRLTTSRKWGQEQPVRHGLGRLGRFGSLIAALGFLGLMVGRWADQTLDTGYAVTTTLSALGVGLGCYLAWHRLRDRDTD